MAQQTIGIGTSANDGTGDTIRDAFDKCNDNFTELYNGLTGLLDFKGSTDCSANPNYPAASKGDFYLVSVAGKIGGASGIVVEQGDSYFATADNAGGTQASVGSSWTVVQGNVAYVPVNKAGDTMTGDLIVPDEAYDATAWNGSLEVPTKNAVRDKIEAVAAGSGSTTLAGLTDVDTSGVADGDALTYDSVSSTWVPGAGGSGGGGGATGERPLVLPASADYTLLNPGTASLSDVPNGMLLTAPSAGTNVRFAKFTAGPASFTNFAIRCRVRPVVFDASSWGSYIGGICVGNSSSGKLVLWSTGYLGGNNFLAQRFTNYTTFSANIIAPAALNGGQERFPWMGLSVSGGNITFQVSSEGEQLISHTTTESVAAFLSSIDMIGVFTMVNLTDASVLFQSIEIS